MQLDRKTGFEGTSAASCSAVSQRASVWRSLEQGDVVTVTLNGYEFHSGSVDDRTPDGRTIWVIDRIGERRLFHIDDDFDLIIGSIS